MRKQRYKMKHKFFIKKYHNKKLNSRMLQIKIYRLFIEMKKQNNTLFSIRMNKFYFGFGITRDAYEVQICKLNFYISKSNNFHRVWFSKN